ncbi:alpha-galactosidase [Tunturiibacter gelidoferens]|uniref:Alpha-galactosidase n=1 Tax=Tunturiibacter gelidiferens TaxID=3069689 RepID=A0A9X0QHR1_9BACT|nr:alpha-galactosidase [Edaphobacter lichenicola]MBB5330435.1 alpha-galactosidase [Edaphobacter lichenicola]
MRAQAVTPVQFNPQSRTFRIDASDMTYAFAINERNELQTIYWGRRIASGDPLSVSKAPVRGASFDTPASTTQQEYSGWGGGMYVEPALKITFPDGNRNLVLHYLSHVLSNGGLTVTLKDISQDVFVELNYTVDTATGILGRSAVIINRTKLPLTIEQAASASWNLPRGMDYTLRYLSGRWAAEDTMNEENVRPGKTVLESRRGSTGHQNNPWFAIERGSSDDEEAGQVWFGALSWSGSWSISVEQDQLRQVRVTGGFSTFDFAYRLDPGERLRTPIFYAGYSSNGIGGASRLLHRFEFTKILPHAPEPHLRPIVYDSWEATGFKVDESGQEELAAKAASIGVERFVMDDGWFGQRKDDHAALGDWYVNPEKFPNGLKPLIDKVHSLGMDFGLWVEPEMVNPDSDLYRKHPEWALNFPGMPRSEARNQLVLNLARKDVRDYLFHFLDDLLSKNDIAFLKWDYNRNWSEPGWDAVASDKQKEVYVKYVENLYGILEQLRSKYPHVEIESCSGGGGRVDLGILGYTDEVWPSDNTDPFDRLTIQDGFSYAYAPGVMMAWVTDSPNWVNNRSTSIEYRFLSSMQGSLGVGANLAEWTPADFAKAKEMIETYKHIRETVQRGSLYRLISPQHDSQYSVTESVSLDKKQAILFTFLHSSQKNYPFPRVFFRGLDPDKQYHLRPIGNATKEDAPEVASGRYWMNRGIDVTLRGDFQAAAFLLESEAPQ